MSEIQTRPAVYDRFLQFRVYVIQAIALSWKDDDFRDRFKSNPRQAFKDAFGYDVPFDIDLCVDLNNAEWNGYYCGEWKVNKQETLEMVLPPKPPAEDQAVALSAYNTNNLTFLN